MILIIDNYDSFTYNLYQYISEVSGSELEIEVKRNDKISLAEIDTLRPSHIILSPGPCTPKEAGISVELVKEFYKEIPVLGVCLGHQAIAKAFGAEIVRASLPCHGKVSKIDHDGMGVFKGLARSINVGRYHSLVVEPRSMPSCLEVTSSTKSGIVMSFRHQQYHSLVGVQFHPESILTESGKAILGNFLNILKPL